MSKNALILSGGGARAAYQVGVLQALTELLPKTEETPFPIICGTSAGAINALSLAGHSGCFSDAAKDLMSIWQSLTMDRVFHTGWKDLAKGVARFGFSLFNEGVGRNGSISLLDNAPLREFLNEVISFDTLNQSIADGTLEAVCVTAMGYTSGESVSFFQGHQDLKEWRRFRRTGVKAQLTVDHLMASAAIPTVFPTVRIDDEFYGDGAVRQTAPISPALHLGADRVFVIGVSSNRNPEVWTKRRMPAKRPPSMAHIVGHMLNSVFIDSLEGDIEHLERVNKLLSLIPQSVLQEMNSPLRPVETMVISPSRPLDKMAGRNVRYLPAAMKFFLSATGGTARGGGSAATSYLLFERAFTDELIELGYKDAMWEKNKIEEFFGC